MGSSQQLISLSSSNASHGRDIHAETTATIQLIFMVIGASSGLLLNGYILFVLAWSNKTGSGRGHKTSHIKSANSLLLFNLATSGLLFSTLILVGNVPLGNGVYSVEKISTKPYQSFTETGDHLFSSSSTVENNERYSGVTDMDYRSSSTTSPGVSSFLRRVTDDMRRKREISSEATLYDNNDLRRSAFSGSLASSLSSLSSGVSAPAHRNQPSDELSNAAISDYDDDLSTASSMSSTEDESNNFEDTEPRVGESSLQELLFGLQGFLWTALPVIMLWNLVAISSDRYTAINSPLVYNRIVNSRKTIFFILMAWLTGICLAVPPFTGICSYIASMWRVASYAKCDAGSSYWEGIYSSGFFLLSFIIPLLVIGSCNVHILIIARSHRSRIVSAIYDIQSPIPAQVATPFCGPHHKSSYYLARYSKGQDGVLVMCELVGSVLILAGPYYVLNLLESFSLLPVEKEYHTMKHIMFAVSSTLLCWFPAVTAYIYGVKSRFLRSTFKRLIAQYLYRKEVTIEIDRRLSLRSQSSLRAAIGWHSLISSTASLAAGHRLSTSSGSYPYSTRTSVLIQNQNHFNKMNALERQRRYSAPMNLSNFLARSPLAATNSGNTRDEAGRQELFQAQMANKLHATSQSFDLCQAGQLNGKALPLVSSSSSRHSSISISEDSLNENNNNINCDERIHYNTIGPDRASTTKYPKIQFNIFSSGELNMEDVTEGVQPKRSPSSHSTHSSTSSNGSRIGRWASILTGGGDKSSSPQDNPLKMSSSSSSLHGLNSAQSDRTTSSTLTGSNPSINIQYNPSMGTNCNSYCSTPVNSTAFLSVSGIKSWIMPPNQLSIGKAQLSPIAEMSSTSTIALGSPMMTGQTGHNGLVMRSKSPLSQTHITSSPMWSQEEEDEDAEMEQVNVETVPLQTKPQTSERPVLKRQDASSCMENDHVTLNMEV